MFKNSDPNSDSEQCIESRLGRVHSAHTHGLGCAQAARALHLGCALRLGCTHSAVSWRALAPCHGRVRSCRRRVAVRTGRVAVRTGRVAVRTGRVAVRTGRVAVRTGRVAVRTSRVAGRAARARYSVVGLSVTIQRLYRNTGLYRTPCSVRCCACHSSLRRIAAPEALCHDARPTPLVTIQSIVS